MAHGVKYWPVDPGAVTRLGQGVMADRGTGRPHQGVDLFVPAGTRVSSPVDGRVIRVEDGRTDPLDSARSRAGLWVDIEGPERKVHRLLHLGSVSVKGGDRLSAGGPVGSVAEAHTSGLGDSPHLHYEIRKWGDAQSPYGDPIDPRPELADVLTARAEALIPGLARAVGVEAYGDERWILVQRQATRARLEADPDKRIKEAKAALAGAMDAAGIPSEDAKGMPSIWGEAYRQAKDPKEGLKFTGQEAASGAVKLAKKGAELAKDAAGTVWDAIPLWAKIAGGGALALGAIGLVSGGTDDTDKEED